MLEEWHPARLSHLYESVEELAGALLEAGLECYEIEVQIGDKNRICVLRDPIVGLVIMRLAVLRFGPQSGAEIALVLSAELNTRHSVFSPLDLIVRTNVPDLLSGTT